jgi:hypothetical protein
MDPAVTAIDIRWHRSALRAHAWASSCYAAIRRGDLLTQHVFSTCTLLATGGGAWDGAAS